MDAERIAKLETQVEGIKEDVADVKNDIKELHSRITTQTREITDKIDHLDRCIEDRMIKNAEISKQQHEAIQKEIKEDVQKVTDRVDVLEKWRWMLIGGAVVVGFLMGHIDFFAKFLK